MKKIILIYGFILVMTTGCSFVLDEEIVSGITSDLYYSDEKGMEDALIAAYAGLKGFYGTNAGYAITNAGTDLHGVARGQQFVKWHLYDPNLNPSESFLVRAWDSFYRVVNITNAILNRAPEAVKDEAVLNRITGEARFLRGFVYFQLVQIWGDVHLTTEETIGAEITANRTPANEIYNTVIIPDLEFAMANLPNSSGQFGRATQPAAKAIRARVAMVQEDWITAEDLTKSIINDYSFSLTNTYSELWDMNNQQNSEVIWSIQFTQSPLVTGINNIGFWTPWYTKHRGININPIDGGTGVGFKPTPYFYSLWDKTKDRRFEEGLKSVWYATSAVPAAGIAVGDTALYYSIDVLSDEFMASKPYRIYDLNELISDDSAWPNAYKVRDESRANLAVKQSRDYNIARLAEMYLLLAESQLHQDKVNEAVQTINVLRRARAIDGKETEMEITGNELNLNFILDERGRELFAEGQRWFVLKRLGLLVERVRNLNPYGAANFIQDYHTLRPIPLHQIDRSANDYPQNPGYN